ncbi:MAG: proton-conducting transporter membrane subunit [Planctomycetota bacterium]
MVWVLVLLPLAFAGLALAVPSNRVRPWLLPTAAVLHTAGVAVVVARPELGVTSPWLTLDPVGRLVLISVSGLFLLCAFYTVGYLLYRQERSNRVFCACLLAFLGTMTLVTFSQHLGLFWVAMEATSLSVAPLIYFNRTPRSLEATWKYLLIGSIGIALALLGSFFLAYASLSVHQASVLTFPALVHYAGDFSKPWLRVACVLLLVGYGTKMGLAPMHTWKPDAYGEAPGVAGAIFAGGITSCAFLALLRVDHIARAAGEGAYFERLLVFIGLLSMAVAGGFMVGQRDFKRTLAYSSVEHMGILALGLGLGPVALFATLLHLVNNAAAKGLLFLSAGNIHRSFGGKNIDTVRGALRRLPLSGALFFAGFLAVTASPPFGPFISEFGILNAAFTSGRYLSGALFLAFLLIVFIGMGATVLAVVQGEPGPEAEATDYRDGWLTGLPPLLFLAVVLVLGVALPSQLVGMIQDAVHFLEVPR